MGLVLLFKVREPRASFNPEGLPFKLEGRLVNSMLAAFDALRIQSRQSRNSVFGYRYEHVSVHEFETLSERVVCNETR